MMNIYNLGLWMFSMEFIISVYNYTPQSHTHSTWYIKGKLSRFIENPQKP